MCDFFVTLRSGKAVPTYLERVVTLRKTSDAFSVSTSWVVCCPSTGLCFSETAQRLRLICVLSIKYKLRLPTLSYFLTHPMQVLPPHAFSQSDSAFCVSASAAVDSSLAVDPSVVSNPKRLGRSVKQRLPKAAGVKQQKRPQCAELGCTTKPSFNVAGERRGLYCGTHKTACMVNVLIITCAEDSCKTQPVFNVEGSVRGLYCVLHKKEGMVDVVSNHCAHVGCRIRASWNFLGGGARYCNKHATDEMVDVVSKTCEEPGCEIWACFGEHGSSYKSFCASHQKAGMVSRYMMRKRVT